ncbi:MAG: hypothetical protein J5764_01285, partial [Bacteroidales bacterium]|nr:hypothetical protein [Bacteroidales bacterium]
NSNSSWKITISGGVATIQAQAGASTMILYNVSSPRFSCYKSTSNAVQTVSIFRKEGGGAVVVEADPLTEFSEYGVVLDGRQRFYEAGTDQFCRQYATGSDVLTYTIMNPSTKEQIEISGYSTSMRKGDSATISVIWRIGLNQILKGSWKLTLVREDGPKVWLSDGKGGGVIIKK